MGGSKVLFIYSSYGTRLRWINVWNLYLNTNHFINEKAIDTLEWRHNECGDVSNTGISIVYSTICSGADQRKHQSFASPAFVRGIHRWPVNSPHKGPLWWRHHGLSKLYLQNWYDTDIQKTHFARPFWKYIYSILVVMRLFIQNGH